jgi:acetate kinase
MLVELGGADAIVFTGGIGENSATIRQAVCRDLKDLGIGVEAARNGEAQGEMRISSAESPMQIWVVPTHEELIVARQTYEAVGE